jgi:hypothetical protein
MRRLSIVCIVLLLICARSSGQEKYRGGIVYGPKAAFNISAPEGWVLDNESGAGQGLPCVLYPKGSSWSDARTIMYAKIASTQYEDVDKFVATAIKEMKDMACPRKRLNREKHATAGLTSSMSIRQRRIIHNGSASLTFNFPELSPTLFSHPGTRRAIGKIPAPCEKC